MSALKQLDGMLTIRSFIVLNSGKDFAQKINGHQPDI